MRTLLVNDTDIATYKATLLSVDYGYSTVTTYKDWLRGASSPLFYSQDEQFSTAIITLVVEGSNIYELDKNCSNLIKSFEKAIVKDTGHDWYLDGTFVEVSDNRVGPLGRELEIQFEGVKYSDSESLTHQFIINEPWEFAARGNLTTSCRIEIAPDKGYSYLDLRINGATFRTQNVSSTTILLTIDGINGTVTADGDNKIDDYEAWSFPILKGGTNVIECNGTPSITITYNGRWM